MTRHWKTCAVILAALGLALPPSAAAIADDAHLMDILVTAYPDFLAGHDGNMLIWKDGTRMPFDDGKPGKPFATLLEQPSIKDMFYTPYLTGTAGFPPAPDIDPGRVRNQPFFTRMYGDCRKSGSAKALVDVVWLPHKWGKKIRFSSINGAAAELAKVSAELDQLPAKFDTYLFPPAGTFNCRVIAGTDRLSAHGAATAIDIALKHSQYWQWEHPDANGHIPWKNQIPIEIIEIFEKHGFIWGGKWYHYDTMHFEYRPDLIAAGKEP